MSRVARIFVYVRDTLDITKTTTTTRGIAEQNGSARRLARLELCNFSENRALLELRVFSFARPGPDIYLGERVRFQKRGCNLSRSLARNAALVCFARIKAVWI